MSVAERQARAADKKAQRSATYWSDIPQGYYATDSLTGSNDLDFWKVDVVDKGTYRGSIFVKRVIGGRGNVHVNERTRVAALTAIRNASPEKAAHVFGQELGRCNRCGRHLTDEESRAESRGPDCRANYGLFG
jgi:hypothetical protein